MDKTWIPNSLCVCVRVCVVWLLFFFRHLISKMVRIILRGILNVSHSSLSLFHFQFLRAHWQSIRNIHTCFNSLEILSVVFLKPCALCINILHIYYHLYDIKIWFWVQVHIMTLYCCCRCFGVGLGPQSCRRLLQGVAKVTGGSTEFLSEEERLQPKVQESTSPSMGEAKTKPLLAALNNTLMY